MIEQLADQGNKDAKKTLVDIEEFHRVTEDIKKNTESNTLIAGVEEGGERFIYDSENTFEFERKLLRKEGDRPVTDEIANITYDFCGSAHDYLKHRLGRNSIDDKGMKIVCNIHFGNEMNNAFWYPQMNQLAFGDGDGRLFLNFARSADVVAHEIAHGVTQYVNHLDYVGQSGALNEHFSDVIGTAVQQFIKGQTAETADWLIGDEIVGPTFPGKAIRSMKNPGTAYKGDRQVAHMKDYKDLPESDDNGGVHYYSGIPNRAFYLVATEIGTDKAAYLWYRAWHNKQIIHQRATFSEAFESILKTARLLIQEGKLPDKTVNCVENAFSEVGLYSFITV